MGAKTVWVLAALVLWVGGPVPATADEEAEAAAVETVTPMLEDDGRWRVSGYFIK